MSRTLGGGLPGKAMSPDLFLKHSKVLKRRVAIVCSTLRLTQHSMSGISLTLAVAGKKPGEVSCAFDENEPFLTPVLV